MRLRIALAALTLVLVVAFTSARPRADDSKLDKKVLDIVKQVGDLYKNPKSLHVDISVEINVDNAGQKQKREVEVACDLKQPNLFALRSHPKGEKDAGLSIVCDGKNLFTLRSKQKQYTETEAPADLHEMGLTLLRLGQQNTSMLFVNVLNADPYEQLMDGVNSCSYAGKEKVGDAEAHHLKFSQDQFDWEMWVATEGKPVVLKMSSNRSADDSKFTMVETYRNWKADAEPGKEAFSFTPPKDAKKVEELQDGQ
jgi:hypothetical protein